MSLFLYWFYSGIGKKLVVVMIPKRKFKYDNEVTRNSFNNIFNAQTDFKGTYYQSRSKVLTKLA